MYIYCFIVGKIDGQKIFNLKHKRKFTQIEFEKMCAEATANRLKKFGKGTSIDEVAQSTVNRLCKHFGFEEFTHELVFYPFGLSVMEGIDKTAAVQPDTWKSHENQHNELIRSYYDEL